MGETGKISHSGRLCCTPPTYVEHYLRVATQVTSRIVFEQNKLIYKEYKRTKNQQAVIGIATLLLSKLEERDAKKE
jgi:hypothetical protein